MTGLYSRRDREACRRAVRENDRILSPRIYLDVYDGKEEARRMCFKMVQRGVLHIVRPGYFYVRVVPPVEAPEPSGVYVSPGEYDADQAQIGDFKKD